MSWLWLLLLPAYWLLLAVFGLGDGFTADEREAMLDTCDCGGKPVRLEHSALIECRRCRSIRLYL